jgi:hypothetical protein
MYFINDGGPFTVTYDQSNLIDVENILKNYFFELKNCTYPIKNVGWWCKAFCSFYKQSSPRSKMNICDCTHKSIGRVGIEKTTELYQIAGFDPFKYHAPGQ